MIEFCHDQNIDLYLFVQPLHASLLGMIGAAGLWGRFEAWKMALVDLADEYRAKPGGPTLMLWDFAEYSEYTTEIRPRREIGRRK